MNNFAKYLNLREGKESTPITSKIKLQKIEGSKDFTPFTVNKTMHPNLRFLIKAFQDSNKVGVGYTTIEKTKGEVEPQLKKKSLWLTGGSVRDHLKGKTPRNYDLVTDATPSEMRMILTQPDAGFTETKPRSGDNEKYAKLPSPGAKNKIFYASRWDKAGKEIEMTVEVNGEKFEVSTLGKHPKSRRIQPEKGELTSTVEEDSANRDFTINAMYIPLTSSDGDNSELIDPHGGAHHLKNNEVVPVGDMNKNLKEDPAGSLRYLKLINRYGNPDKISDKHKQAIERHKDLHDVPKDLIRSEFLDGLEHPDTDPRKYIKSFKQTGMLGAVFPGVGFDEEDIPKDFVGDRWLAPAWVMRNNEPEEVKKTLVNNGWSKQEASDIAYLVKLYNWGAKGNFDPNQFYDIKNTHTGLTKNKIREWMQMSKQHGPEIDAFLKHDDKDLIPFSANGSLNPAYSKHLGRTPFKNEIEPIKKVLSTKKWQSNIGKI